MTTFRAFRIHQDDGRNAGTLETIGLDALSEGVIRYSTIDCKDTVVKIG